MGFTLQSSIQEAFKLQNYQLAGGPAWLNSEKFDVDAKMEPAIADALKKLPLAEQDSARRKMLLAISSLTRSIEISPQRKRTPRAFARHRKRRPETQESKPVNPNAPASTGRGSRGFVGLIHPHVPVSIGEG